jgi:HKD family nuclease
MANKQPHHKPAPCRVGLVTNSGPNCLLPYLRAAGSSCKQIDIAVAFITASGLESILHLLQRVSHRGRVRILTGLYQGFTEPRALALLLREQQEASSRFSVRICRDKRFHWKSYFLVGGRTATAIVGSSNMTSEGLTERGELNLVVTAQRDAKPFVTAHSAFEKYWDKESQPLTKEVVTRYREWHDEQPASTQRLVPLKRILGKAAVMEEHADSTQRRRCWRLSCVSHLDDATVDLLDRLTDWDKQGYDTLSTFTSRIRAGDRAIMFDFQAARMTLVEIMHQVETPSRTPDGRYFIAYKSVRCSTWKRLTPSLWKLLREKKIVKGRGAARLIHSLPERAYAAAEDLLRRK